jgi:hypothetical protein
MAVALPAPAGGGPNTSGKRPVRTQPSRAVPHSGQRGDRNPFTTSPPTSPFPRAAPQDILRRCLLLYPVTPVQTAQCRSIPGPQALRKICRARPGALQSCGREWGVRRSWGFSPKLFRLQTKHASFLSLSCPCCHTAAESQALSARVCVGRPRPVFLHEREGKPPSLKKSRTLAST